MKWVVFGSGFIEERYRFLSSYMSQKGLENELEIISPEGEKIADQLPEIAKNAGQIRIENLASERLAKELTHVTSEILTVKNIDAYINSGDGWWPKNFMSEAVVRLCARRVSHLDLKSPVFIVGATEVARSMVNAFVKMGFHRINITDRFNETAQALASDLKKSYFAMQIEFTPSDALTLLPGNHQIVVNTIPFAEENDLLNELYYFNYLKKEGVVIDMTLVPAETPLLEEAGSIHATTIAGFEIAAWLDVLWLKECFSLDVDVEDYTKGLKEALANSSGS